MADRMTYIRLRTTDDPGFADRGLVPAAAMIAAYREKARRELEAAQAILAAPDDAFHIETYVGVYVMRNRRVIQEGT
jgi:hypothetical protein